VRMKIIRIVCGILAGVLFAVMIAATACSDGTASGTGIGDKAPDFELKDMDGTQHSLSDQKGSPVLLNFWATWCGPCRSEMPHLEDISKEWKDDGLVFFAVNMAESAPGVQEYLDYFGFTMPVLLDTARTVATSYNIAAVPTTYFIDKDGIIQDKVVGAFPDKESIEKYLEKLVK